jgi:hypothetical protein
LRDTNLLAFAHRDVVLVVPQTICGAEKQTKTIVDAIFVGAVVARA